MSGKEKTDNREDQDLKFDVNDDVILAFKIRFQLEKELKRIWNLTFPNPPRLELSLISILGNLQRFGPISEEFSLVAKEVISITNELIHGESISEIQNNYLRVFAPILLKTLRSFPDQVFSEEKF